VPFPPNEVPFSNKWKKMSYLKNRSRILLQQDKVLAQLDAVFDQDIIPQSGPETGTPIPSDRRFPVFNLLRPVFNML
jgi:hypothetical protein